MPLYQNKNGYWYFRFNRLKHISMLTKDYELALKTAIKLLNCLKNYRLAIAPVAPKPLERKPTPPAEELITILVNREGGA